MLVRVGIYIHVCTKNISENCRGGCEKSFNHNSTLMGLCGYILSRFDHVYDINDCVVMVILSCARLPYIQEILQEIRQTFTVSVL